jgi:predicted dehydrogenase
MADRKVKIGFVGVGGMGQCAHLRNYVTVPGCEVVAIAEVRQDLGRKVAAHYGVPRVYRDHAEMLGKEKLDAIVASQPFTRHGTLIPELFAAKVPVFTEKPLAGSIEMGERVIEAARKAGTWHMVGYHKRSDPATMLAKVEIERLRASGELGRLTYVRILMPSGDWVAGGFTELIGTDEKGPELASDPPARDMDRATNDAYISFVNYYVHQVNLMRHLLGESWRVTYADPSGVLLAGVSAGGAGCAIEMTPYRTTVAWDESALVAFEKGYVRLDLPAPLSANRPGRVEIFRDPGDGKTPETVVPQLPWVHAMKQQAVNFVRAVKGEMKPLCGSEEAIEDLRLAREYIRLWKGK